MNNICTEGTSNHNHGYNTGCVSCGEPVELGKVHACRHIASAEKELFHKLLVEAFPVFAQDMSTLNKPAQTTKICVSGFVNLCRMVAKEASK